MAIRRSMFLRGHCSKPAFPESADALGDGVLSLRSEATLLASQWVPIKGNYLALGATLCVFDSRSDKVRRTSCFRVECRGGATTELPIVSGDQAIGETANTFIPME